MSEKDLSKIAGNASFAPGHPNILINSILIEYKQLTAAQVEEMAKLLQGGVEKRAGSIGNLLLVSFEYFCSLNLDFKE